MARQSLASESRILSRRHRARAIAPLSRIRPVRGVSLELSDYSRATQSAVHFFGSENSASPQAQAARLADQFIRENSALFRLLEVDVYRDYDGTDVLLNIESHGTVGALPLRSPLTARPDFGLVVQPRFPWAGIGPMLAEMGWLISPTPLRLPLLKRSERRVPLWVLSCMLLPRFKALLDRLDRRFEITTEVRSAPKGRVDWTQFATRQMARGDLLSVPCTFPDLRDDRLLKGAVRFAVENQLRSLQTQSLQGAFVHRLIAFAESLLWRVQSVPSRRPSARDIQQWFRRPLHSNAFSEGLEAIHWTAEERGLAGMSDLEGIPWTLPMEQFFEAWVETVMKVVARRVGGQLKTGRERQTVSPLTWDPTLPRSQASLVPDLILDLDSVTVIVDAKYKRHWEELHARSLDGVSDLVRERHRADLLQILAYANLAPTPRVICCLVYPCTEATWLSLKQRGRLFHRADLPNRSRRISLWLTAVPMSVAATTTAEPISEMLRSLASDA